MIPVDLSRAGTQATTPRRDKPAGVGDAAFGVQMQKALAAGPSDRRGGGDRPHMSAPPVPDLGHAGRARERASEDARSTARNAARNSGMEGAGPEPGASALSMQAPGLPGAVRTETVPAGAASMAAPAGTVTGAVPAAGAPLAGTPAAGETIAVELPLSPGLAITGGYPPVLASGAQAPAGALSTTAAPQVPLQAAAGAAGTAAAAAPQGLPAGSAVSGGTNPVPSSVAVAAPMEATPDAAASGLPGAGHPGPAAPGTAGGAASGTAPGTSAGGVASGTAAAAPSAHVDGEPADQARPAVVPSLPSGAPGAPAQAPGAAVTAAPAPATAHAPAPAHPPLAGQLSGPLFSLASARAGDHTMTLSVTPENLGPVTVRAHIGAEGVRVELFAPNDAGREALRAILQDLRRDLAAAGLGTSLDLSARSGPHDGPEDGGGGTAGERDGDGSRRLRLPPGQAAIPAAPDTHVRNAGTTGLDVMA